TSGGYAWGYHRDCACRHHVCGLVREKAEDRAAAQPQRSLLDDADVEVAVLDRSGEIALLVRRPHGRVLARGHSPAEHQRLRAAAHGRHQSADHNLVPPRLGQCDFSDLPAPRRAEPERICTDLHWSYPTSRGLRAAGAVRILARLSLRDSEGALERLAPARRGTGGWVGGGGIRRSCQGACVRGGRTPADLDAGAAGGKGRDPLTGLEPGADRGGYRVHLLGHVPVVRWQAG